MANKQNPERVTRRTHTVACFVLVVSFGALIWHALSLPDGQTTGFFTAHANATVGVGVFAAIVWCTRQILRAQRKTREKLTDAMARHDQRILTPNDVKRMIQEVFDEGQITGLATGLADLSRSPQGGRPIDN